MEDHLPLVTRGLSKSYRVGHIRQSRRPALHDLDLEVLEGEILGYVGPNGSGKTTTLKLLTGLLAPDRGEAQFFGLPLADRAWRSSRTFDLVLFPGLGHSIQGPGARVQVFQRIADFFEKHLRPMTNSQPR